MDATQRDSTLEQVARTAALSACAFVADGHVDEAREVLTAYLEDNAGLAERCMLFSHLVGQLLVITREVQADANVYRRLAVGL